MLTWALNRSQNTTLVCQIRSRYGRKLGLRLPDPATVALGTELRRCLGRGSLGRRSLGRRSLNRGSRRVALTFRPSRLLIGDGLAFHGPQFCAVGHQYLDEIALRLNDRTLFDDQHGHQTVGEQEHHGEQRNESPLLLWNHVRNCDRHHRCGTEQSSQAAPRPALTKAGTVDNAACQPMVGAAGKH